MDNISLSILNKIFFNKKIVKNMNKNDHDFSSIRGIKMTKLCYIVQHVDAIKRFKTGSTR